MQLPTFNPILKWFHPMVQIFLVEQSESFLNQSISTLTLVIVSNIIFKMDNNSHIRKLCCSYYIYSNSLDIDCRGLGFHTVIYMSVLVFFLIPF